MQGTSRWNCSQTKVWPKHGQRFGSLASIGIVHPSSSWPSRTRHRPEFSSLSAHSLDFKEHRYCNSSPQPKWSLREIIISKVQIESVFFSFFSPKDTVLGAPELKQMIKDQLAHQQFGGSNFPFNNNSERRKRMVDTSHQCIHSKCLSRHQSQNWRRSSSAPLFKVPTHFHSLN